MANSEYTGVLRVLGLRICCGLRVEAEQKGWLIRNDQYIDGLKSATCEYCQVSTKIMSFAGLSVGCSGDDLKWKLGEVEGFKF